MPRRLKMLDQFYNGVNHMEVKIRDSQDDVIEHIKECSEKATKLVEEAKQKAKADKGKIKPALVPPQIIRDIAVVREYGCEKYHSPDNWKKVEKERYENALLRHTLAWMDDKQSKDKESGIEHYKHMACNMAFLCEMYEKEKNPVQHVNVIPQYISTYDTVIGDSCSKCKNLRVNDARTVAHCAVCNLMLGPGGPTAKTTCNYFEEKEECLTQQK